MLKTYLTASVVALACVLSSCHHNSATTNRNSITNTQSIQGLAPDSMIGKTITLSPITLDEAGRTYSWVNATSNYVRNSHGYTTISHSYSKTGYNTATIRDHYHHYSGMCDESNTESVTLTFLTPTSGKYRSVGEAGLNCGMTSEGTFTLK